MTKYEYDVFVTPLADFMKRSLNVMNRLGAAGWHVFHLHEVIVDGVPSMLVYMSRKLEERTDDDHH